MTNAIIEQGRGWKPEEYLKKAAEIRLRVKGKYSEEYAKASWWGKQMIGFKISREVAKELRVYDPRYRL